ncbi:MAG: serine/threonine protein kinase, partial [Microcystaceae cyanobacterium]
MFKAKDILTNRYQLRHQLGRTAVGRQTWLAVELQPQNLSFVSRFRKSWQALKKLKFLPILHQFASPEPEEQITVK